MFKSVDGLDGIEAALYVFHDQPIEGKRLMRATTAAYLTSTGELFIGCACASEGDQFTRQAGREQAVTEAFGRLKGWTHKSLKIKPDAILNMMAPLQTNTGYDGKPVYQSINTQVQEECLRFQLERFRLILADRYAIIKELNKELDAWETDTLNLISALRQ